VTIEINNKEICVEALVVKNLSKALIWGHNFLATAKSVIDYNNNKVTFQHGSDKLIINFRDRFENSYETTEECEPQQDLFVNIANEPTVNSPKITVATDYVLKPGNDIITRLNLNLRPSDLVEYCFIEIWNIGMFFRNRQNPWEKRTILSMKLTWEMPNQ